MKTIENMTNSELYELEKKVNKEIDLSEKAIAQGSEKRK